MRREAAEAQPPGQWPVHSAPAGAAARPAAGAKPAVRQGGGEAEERGPASPELRARAQAHAHSIRAKKLQCWHGPGETTRGRGTNTVRVASSRGALRAHRALRESAALGNSAKSQSAAYTVAHPSTSQAGPDVACHMRKLFPRPH